MAIVNTKSLSKKFKSLLKRLISSIKRAWNWFVGTFITAVLRAAKRLAHNLRHPVAPFKRALYLLRHPGSLVVLARRSWRQVRAVVRATRRQTKQLLRAWEALPLYAQLVTTITLIFIVAFAGLQFRHHQLYTLDVPTRQLLSSSSIDTSKIKVTAKTIMFDTANQKPTGRSRVTIAAPTDSTGKTGYQATINTDFKQGLNFGDSNGELSFNMTPLFSASRAQHKNGQVLFPVSGSSKIVQTFKQNGVKEDIILTKAPARTASWQWRLDLGDKLAAKLLPDGSVGIFAANPNLYGNIQISDAKSQTLIDKARTTAKDYFIFAIPAPNIKNAKGQTLKEDVSYKLAGNTLTLEARNLNNQHYPISIDPSVVVTTTADFATGMDDGMIDYSTANQIGRSNVSLGTVGATVQQTNAFTTPRQDHTSVVYNGYLYVIGGNGNGTNNDIIHCPINADGSIGACVQQTNAFTTGRQSHTSVVYNGYLYVIGGYDNGTGGNINDIQHCPINADGSVGVCVQQTNAFIGGRYYHTSVVYNGYLYVIGGYNGGVWFNDVQHCPINADGSIGTCVQQTNAFTPKRQSHTSVAYNGYLYVIGGQDDTYNRLNDIQYCPINADGSVGVCVQQANAFTTPRQDHTSVVYNGYLYIIGGSSTSNDIIHCPINADGSVGACVQQTNAFTTGRQSHTSVVYNGYLYVIGGYDNGTGGHMNDIQHLFITTGTPTGFGEVGATVQQTNAFTTPRYTHTSVVYNAYLYVIGGGGNNDIQRCPINADGSVGACLASGSFTTARGDHTSVAYNGYLYVIGGYGGATGLNDIQRCPINPDGTLGTCVVSGSFTTARHIHTSVAYNGYLYVIGGYNGGVWFNDIQHCPINADGSVGACVQQTNAFTTPRFGHTSVVYNGYLYVIGGYDYGGGPLNDIQHAPILAPAQSAHYERVVDAGSVGGKITSIQYNGTAKCGVKIQYSTAGIDGVFGALTTLRADAVPGITYALSGQTQIAQRYVRVVITLNDQSCGSNSTVTDLTVNYLQPPAAPTLVTPANGTPGLTTTPLLQLKTTIVGASPYAKYKILIYQSNCSTLVRTIDQTASQTGWSGQDASAGTAYVIDAALGSSTLASHTAAALSFGTTYCWKAAAIDPDGSNTWGAYSATHLFTINQSPAAPTLSQPTAAQGGISLLPELRLFAVDLDGDYLRYKIQVCSISNCSSVLRTIDQTGSQVGWISQSQQNATAYSSGQTAIHTYQITGLTASTQYWWRAFAIDPGGTNIFGPASAIGTFTTGLTIKPNVNIGGGTTIYGGSTLRP